MRIFRFINGKDVFEAFYKKDLGKRTVDNFHYLSLYFHYLSSCFHCLSLCFHCAPCLNSQAVATREKRLDRLRKVGERKEAPLQSKKAARLF